MKTILLLVLVVGLTPKSVNHSANDADVEAVKQLVINSYQDIWSDLRTDKIKEHYTDDFILLDHGVVKNNDFFADYLKEATQNQLKNPQTRKNRFEFLNAEKQGDAIKLTYHNYVDYVNDNTVVKKAKWAGSTVAIKTEKGWRLRIVETEKIN